MSFIAFTAPFIVASGALCIISANKFDAGYKDRTGACDNANDTNATIDGYTNATA